MNIKIITSELHTSASETVQAELDLEKQDRSLAETLEEYAQKHQNTQEDQEEQRD